MKGFDKNSGKAVLGKVQKKAPAATRPLSKTRLWGEGTTKTTKEQMLRSLVCSDAPEQALRHHGFSVIAGVDEVGRGALCGPVVAAAVILPEVMAHLGEMGLKDSKQLTREERESLDGEIRQCAVAVSIASVDNETIDRVNIYQASRMAMQQAVDALPQRPDHVLIDAMHISGGYAQTKLIYGDSLSLSIAAASVVAKVFRDALMRGLHEQHPHYGFDSHKGYATPEHRRALLEHGPTTHHRMTFAPVAACLTRDREGVLELQIEMEDLYDEEVTEL